ncbi:unnamed protein product [Brachionus calyciflorus]|uniref:Uncharacterized protein n=1 Tax=Brachionus calyciflorus TaxID=104777 RepID=A0A814BJL4_9BILA|nr:unnamed protein product [Brachionus calyciflorus]
MHLSNSSNNNNNNNKSKLYEHIINDKSNKVSYNHGSNVTNMRHLKNFIENYKYNNNPFVNTNYPIYNPMTTKNTNNNNNNNNKNTSTTISHLFTNVSDKMKSNNHQKPPAPFKNTSSTNKTTTTIATTDNKHKYFDNSSNNRNNQHPILNNGFMKPQIVIGGNDTSFQNETSSSSSSSTSSSNSSFNNNNNTNINLNRRFSLNSNQNESNILDSQKARDAFYKSLRTIENKPSQTVVLNHQQQKQIINSKLQNNTSSSSSSSSSTSTSSIQSSSHNQSNSSRSTTSCELKDLNLNGNDTKSLNRPYDFKNNFSNLVKIDTRFKSDSFDVNYNSTKNEESQNQLRLLEESQNRMRHFQELINQQKARHRETITSLLHRRQNLAHAKSNSFNFPSNSDKNLQTIEKITETIDDSNVDTNEEKLSNLIGENNVPLNNSTPNESLTSLKSITVTTPKELNQKFQTYNENNSILNNKTTTITTTVSTLTNKSTTNSQDLKFKIQNIINTAVETQTKQKNLINNSNPVQTTTTTTIKTITTNNLSNVIMPKNNINNNSSRQINDINRILRITSPIMNNNRPLSVKPYSNYSKKQMELSNDSSLDQFRLSYRTSLNKINSDVHLNTINQLKKDHNNNKLCLYNYSIYSSSNFSPMLICQFKNSPKSILIREHKQQQQQQQDKENKLPLPPIDTQRIIKSSRINTRHNNRELIKTNSFPIFTSDITKSNKSISKTNEHNFVSNYLSKSKGKNTFNSSSTSSSTTTTTTSSTTTPVYSKLKLKNELVKKNAKNRNSRDRIYFSINDQDSSNYLDVNDENECNDEEANFECDEFDDNYYYELNHSNLSGIDQVEKDDDDNNYDQELDDDGDNDDDDYNELDQKDKKISKTTLLTSSDIYSSLSSASLAEESDSENDENSIPTTKTDKNDEDYVLDVHSMSDILSKYGYDYKYLFNETTIKKSDQNTSVIQPPLTLSLFANVPPTIKFITQDEKINQLPESLNRLCKWKMCAITPNIVKATISRSNFKLANGKHDWIGVWGSHMKPECFRAIREYQKINHLPGSFQIGRKDRLCRNLYHAQAIFGKQEYNFVPITYVLPQDYNLLKQEIETKNCKWIIKPPASARGQGIRVVNKIEQIPKKRACVVQKYLSNPYLIDGLKFDLRIYVYVTSYDPLRIYIFNDGLTRFASRKYSNSSKTIGDKFMHLTNFSINKTNKEYKSNDDENACVGHKWSLKALWAYLQKKGINTDKIWEQIKDLAIKTIICGDPHVNILVKTHLKRKYSVHELFGFDVILDENLKPWIVEVNISPSLNSSSPLDVSVKGQMICDLFNLAGFMLPDPREIAKQEGKKSYKKIPKFLHFNKSVLPQILSNDEKTKHQYFIQRQNDDKVMSSILDRLTPDDLRILIESEDEYNRRGSFIRIFPSSNSQKYLRLFETTRYYNLLLNEWVSRYRNNRDRAITLLNSCCQKNIHIQNPSRQAENCWSSLPEANK